MRFVLLATVLLLSFATAASTASTVVVVNNNNVCRDSRCSPNVCLHLYSHSFQCVQCRDKSQCSGGTPYCVANTCRQCLGASDCASDSNCDVTCENNSCAPHSGLNCKTENSTRTGFLSQPFCYIGQQKCVECRNDAECSNAARPYCNLASNTCEACLNDLQCRSDANCDARCNTSAAVHEQTCYNSGNTTQCTTTELCYKAEAQCHPKCNSDTQCGTMFTDKLYCHTSDGKCEGCLHDVDCGSANPNTCGRHCSYVSAADNMFCAGGTNCNKPNALCLPASDHWFCSGSSLILPAVSFIALALAYAVLL